MGKRHRGNGDGTTYKVPGRRKPWVASVTVGWTLEGRPIRRARYASSEREAKAMLLEMIAARDSGRPIPDPRMTVGKWLTTWVGSLEGLRPNSIDAYRRSVRALLPELGSTPLRMLRSGQVEQALSTIPGKASRTNARAVLSTAMKDAMRAGHVTTNEAALARGPRMSRKALPAPDTATVRAVLAELESHRLHALYVLLAGTGLRIGEATGLRWEDLDGIDGRHGNGPTWTRHGEDRGADHPRVGGSDQRLGATDRRGERSAHTSVQDAGNGMGQRLHLRMEAADAPRPLALTVRYQLQRIDGEHVLTDPKTDMAGRPIHLPPTVSAALARHRIRQAEERLRAGRKWRDTGLVFTNPEGEPIAESTAQWVLAAACKRAGTRHVKPHDLRRFAASQIEDALGREAAQLLLGHTTPAMTERYVSVRDGMLRRAAEALEEAIR